MVPLHKRLTPTLGAKPGAIPCGQLWTGVDAGGIGSLAFRAVWTAVDVCGHGLEIYGSGGSDPDVPGSGMLRQQSVVQLIVLTTPSTHATFR